MYVYCTCPFSSYTYSMSCACVIRSLIFSSVFFLLVGGGPGRAKRKNMVRGLVLRPGKKHEELSVWTTSKICFFTR